MKSRIITIVLSVLCAGVLAAAAFTVTGYVRYFAGEDDRTAAETPAKDPNAGLNGNKDTGDPSDIHGTGNTDSGGKKENSGDYEFKGAFGEFTAQTFAGGTFSESSFSACGVNLVNVWTTFCSPCIKEMPELNELSEEYAGTVQVIGICADTADENGKPSEKLLELGKKIAEEDLSLSYTMLVPSGELQKGVLKDVYAYPTTYITDDAGNIYEVIVGRKSREEFAGLLEKYIEP